MNRQELDEAILEVKEEIHELEGLLEIKEGWSWKRRSDVYDERLSKLERLDELQEQRRVLRAGTRGGLRPPPFFCAVPARFRAPFQKKPRYSPISWIDPAQITSELVLICAG